MAEYYALLKKAVAGLDAGAEDIRRSIYDKARQALVAQLKGINPPLTTAEISRQRLELEEAIRKVEREATMPAVRDARSEAINAATRAMEAAIMPTPPRPTRLTASPAAPAPQPPVDREAERAQAVFRRAMQDAADRGRNAPLSPPPPADFSPRSLAPEPEHLDPLPLDPPVPDVAVAGPDRDLAGGRPFLRPDPEADPRPQTPRMPPVARLDAEPAVEADWVDSEVPVAGAADPEPPPTRRGRSKAAETRRAVDPPRGFYDGSARPSRLPAIIISLLVVAVLIAGGMVGWTYRNDLVDFIGSFTGGDGPAQQAAAGGADGKDEARVVGPGASAAGPPARVAAAAPVAPSAADANSPAANPAAAAPAPDASQDRVRIVGELPPDPANPAAPAALATRGLAPGDPAAPAAPGPEIALAAPPPAAPGAGAPAAAIAVGQRAVLHEEQPVGVSPPVVIVPGAVTWRFEADGGDGPAVFAEIDLPDRDAQVRLTIRRNNDSTFLPASHLIEVTVTLPADSPTGGIQSIPSLVMKASEEARGTQLVGQSIKITDGMFWIALSAADAEIIAQNTATLREQAWFDLPLLYGNGQRAILTFEKGAPGEQVFAQALAAWAG